MGHHAFRPCVREGCGVKLFLARELVDGTARMEDVEPSKRPIPARKNPWPKGRKLQWRKA